MSKKQNFSSLIVKVILLGGAVTLVFYAFLFRSAIMITENMVVERRINMVAPYHFTRFERGELGVFKVDPLMTIYSDYQGLPEKIKRDKSATEIGTWNLNFDDESEVQLHASEIDTPDGPRIVYAVENSDPLEWSDDSFLVFEVLLLLVGLILFGLIYSYMIKTVRKVAQPFNDLASYLENLSAEDFRPITPNYTVTFEYQQIVHSLNVYRKRIEKLVAREQSFTRYISHELRTPMTIIKAALSNIRRNSQLKEKDDSKHNKYIHKIETATQQMHELTNTFLMLSRDENLNSQDLLIDDTWLREITDELSEQITANQVSFAIDLQSTFSIDANPQLFKVLIQNIINNAVACSFQGKVTLQVNTDKLEVIDSGVGLDAKPRGYEGFGIGLVLVEDICRKYGWHFSLVNNSSMLDKTLVEEMKAEEFAGCRASVTFKTQ